LPTGDPEEPWPRAPFGEPALTGITADLAIATDRLIVGDSLQVLNGKLRLGAAPDRIDLDVKSGDALGGTVAGGVSVRNVGGNASLTGNFSLVGGALDSVVWQRGRSITTGTLDVSANIEAAAMVASSPAAASCRRHLNPVPSSASDVGQNSRMRPRPLGSYIDNGSLSFTQWRRPSPSPPAPLPELRSTRRDHRQRAAHPQHAHDRQ
jgi:hypothetical protein